MAKLIRDRSTPEQDAWWSAVQDAAKTAPKLTYERSAQMASEDVLERLEVFSRKHVDYRNEESAWQEISAIVYAIRELRRDRDLLARLQGGPYFVVRLDAADALNRENVERFRGMGIIRLLDADAAMGGEG